jgi:hypothetical protein
MAGLRMQEVEEYLERLVDYVRCIIGAQAREELWRIIHGVVERVGSLDKARDIINDIVDDAISAAFEAFTKKLRESYYSRLGIKRDCVGECPLSPLKFSLKQVMDAASALGFKSQIAYFTGTCPLRVLSLVEQELGKYPGVEYIGICRGTSIHNIRLVGVEIRAVSPRGRVLALRRVMARRVNYGVYALDVDELREKLREVLALREQLEQQGE